MLLGGYPPVWLGLLRVVGRVAYRSAVGVRALLHVDAHGGVDAADFIHDVSGTRILRSHAEVSIALLTQVYNGTDAGIADGQLALRNQP